MKIDRLIGILSILLQQDKVTAPYLAEKFEVSRRTINRDVEDICKAPRSITGQYLSGRKKIKVPEHRREGNGHFIEIKGATQNNLRDVDVKIPLGVMTCITGISGSGIVADQRNSVQTPGGGPERRAHQAGRAQRHAWP